MIVVVITINLLVVGDSFFCPWTCSRIPYFRMCHLTIDMNECVCFGKQYYYGTYLELRILKVRVLKIVPFIYHPP